MGATSDEEILLCAGGPQWLRLWRSRCWQRPERTDNFLTSLTQAELGVGESQRSENKALTTPQCTSQDPSPDNLTWAQAPRVEEYLGWRSFIRSVWKSPSDCRQLTFFCWLWQNPALQSRLRVRRMLKFLNTNPRRMTRLCRKSCDPEELLSSFVVILKDWELCDLITIFDTVTLCTSLM